MLKRIREHIKNWVKHSFCKREIPRGKILVAWRDVDDMVQGWVMSADDEVNLLRVASMIVEAKKEKLERIINAKGGHLHEGKG